MKISKNRREVEPSKSKDFDGTQKSKISDTQETVGVLGKKAQQEILGFVLIVSLVVIIAVIFLGFSLRKPNLNLDQQNIDAENFLTSLFDYTTNCTLRTNLASMQVVIKACYNGENCKENISSCSYLSSSLKEILQLSFQQNASLEVYTDINAPIFSQKTSCSAGYSAAQKLINAGETNIIIELKLCDKA